MDGDLLTKIFFGAISSLVLMWLGPKIYRLFSQNKTKSDKSQPISYANKITETADKYSIDDQKEILSDLKYKNILTETEYKEKLKIIVQKEQKIIKLEDATKLKMNQDRLDIIVKKHISPTVTKLEDLLIAELITKDEFDKKSQKLFDDTKNKLKDIPFQTIEFNNLNDWQKKSVRKFLKLNKEGNMILFNKKRNSIFLLTESEVNELLNTESYVNYYYIDLPT